MAIFFYVYVKKTPSISRYKQWTVRLHKAILCDFVLYDPSADLGNASATPFWNTRREFVLRTRLLQSAPFWYVKFSTSSFLSALLCFRLNLILVEKCHTDDITIITNVKQFINWNCIEGKYRKNCKNQIGQSRNRIRPWYTSLLQNLWFDAGLFENPNFYN